MAGQLSEMIESFRTATEPVREKMDSWKKSVNGYASKRTEQLYRSVLASPVIFVMLLLIIAAFLGQRGMSFQDQIEDDVEIFLPDGAESTDLLLEVREEWSTDIAVIYIQTDNARLGGGLGDNITDETILREISWIEGDDDNKNNTNLPLTGRGMDPEKADYGGIDGVLWIISPAQIMKEINSSDGRFNTAMCENGINTRTPFEVDCGNDGGRYSIPDQNRIDQIIQNSSGSFEALIKDTNDNDLTFDSDGDGDPTNDMDGDGIWDTTAVIVGMRSDVPETWDGEFDELLDHFQDIIDNRSLDLQSTEMTVTGLTKTLEDISDAIYKDLIKMMPYSVLFTILVISFLHRSAKVVIITGTPILLALAVTFGASVVLKWTLTPMIVATFPILIGLGVDYALHMVNRIEEVRRKELERIFDENLTRKRQGKDLLEEPDLWDKEFYIECVTKMASSTGVAVFLSALTTMVGFSVLIAPQIVSIAPIRSVGLTLVVGIFSTLLFSIVLVPALAWLLKFHKRTNPGMWKNIGKVPVRFFVIILLVTSTITVYGVANMDELNEPITGSSEAPEGIESLDKIAQYSEQFDSGQTSMFVFDATNRANDNEMSNIRDLPVMDAVDRLEQKIDAVESTNTTSIITFLKAVPASIQLTDDIVFYEGSLWDLLHEDCWESEDPLDLNCPGWTLLPVSEREDLRNDMVNVAFDTLSLEVRSMLLNQDETKAIVYVDQPYMNLNIAAGLRNQIDDILTQPPELDQTRTSKLTGGLPVSLDINDGIHDTQSRTTILTMIILTIVLAIVFRSIRLGIITMIPVAVVILWQPLLMQSGDVNVNIFTAMIGTIVFGIGVDDAIHVMHRIQEEGENSTGIAHAVEETGQTIFETTITTVAGISAGFLAAFPGLENFFMLMCLLIVFAFVTSSFVLPSILVADHTARDLIKGRTTLQEIVAGDDPWRDMSGDMTLTKVSDLAPLDAVLQPSSD
jgi:predicted RND superfamily exporter protein